MEWEKLRENGDEAKKPAENLNFKHVQMTREKYEKKEKMKTYLHL